MFVTDSANTDECFHCGKPVKNPVIQWWGGVVHEKQPLTVTITFHPPCATDFLLRLGHDVWRWQLWSGLRFQDLGS